MYVDRQSVPLGRLLHRAALHPVYVRVRGSRLAVCLAPWSPLSGVEANPARKHSHHGVLSSYRRTVTNTQ